MAEFVVNNSASVTTGVSPFFATRGIHPRMAEADFTMPPVHPTGPRRLDEESAQEFALEMTKLYQYLR
jgi:hypothetical protein